MEQYPPLQNHVERLIAAARVALAISALLVIWLDPSQPATFGDLTYAALWGYIIYAFAMTFFAWRTPIFRATLRVSTLAFDLMLFSSIIFLTESSTSPFLLYYVFSLVCAALRWQWHGIVCTAPAALLAFVGAGALRINVLHDANLDLNHLIMGTTYVAFIASLLSYTEAHKQRLNNTLCKLAARPRIISYEPDIIVRNVLAHAADILQVPRVLMIWEDREEPYSYVAIWSPDEFSWSREPPTTYDSPVAETLANTSFLCPDAHAPEPKVLHLSSTGLQRWHGIPLHPNLQKQFAIGPVLSSSLRGEIFDGRLFFLDRVGFSADDLVLGDCIAHQAAADLDQFHLAQRRQQAAITEERLRLVRNLHDGLLQSLTGMALQLEETCQLLGKDPPTAHAHLREIQRMVADEQRDLRFLVSELKPTVLDPVEAHLSLAARLEAACGRIQCQWGLQVELNITSPEAPLPTTLTYDIYYLIHEALVNAARHAHASAARAELSLGNDHVRIAVADNGRGFAFQGHYNLATLTHLNLGPVMLRERITSLRGSLILESTSSGARVEICLPLTPPQRHDTNMCGLGR